MFDCRVCGLRTETCGYKKSCQDIVKLRLLNLQTNITKLRRRLHENLTNTKQKIKKENLKKKYFFKAKVRKSR